MSPTPPLKRGVTIKSINADALYKLFITAPHLNDAVGQSSWCGEFINNPTLQGGVA